MRQAFPLQKTVIGPKITQNGAIDGKNVKLSMRKTLGHVAGFEPTTFAAFTATLYR